MEIGVGILGGGTVGGELARRLLEDRDAILAKSGIDLRLRGVAVRELDKPRALSLPICRGPDGPARFSPRGGSGGGTDGRSGSRPGVGSLRPGSGQAGDHRQQGTPVTARTRTLRPGGRQRGLSSLRGGGGRRNTPDTSSLRIPGGRENRAGDGNRQRNHQFHPDRDGYQGDSLRGGSGRGTEDSDTPRPIRPPMSVEATLPPKPPSWPDWLSGDG